MSLLTTPATELVTLKDGLSVSRAALLTLWALEERAFTITEDGGVLRVKPSSNLTSADDAAIRQHRDELVALVRYCERVQ
jgi:hypothetical protein